MSITIFRQILTKYIIGSALLSTQTLDNTQNLSKNMSSSTSAMSASDLSVAYVTAPNTEVAKDIAQKLVEKGLSACVNIIPSVISIYKWKGNIENDSEVLMIIKTRTSTIERLVDFVKANHPYEVCEVISFPIQYGNTAYLKWLSDSMPL